MSSWQRVSTGDPGLVNSAALAGGATMGAGICGAGLIQARLLPLLAVPALLLIAGLVFAVQRARIGIAVNDSGVRVRWMRRSRIIAWSDIAEVRVDDAILFGSPAGHRCVAFVLTDGEIVTTPVWLVERHLFATARKTISWWAVALAPAQGADILAILCHHHKAAVPAAYVAPPPVPVAPSPRDDRQLRTLDRLRERGSISEAEYARRRAEFGADE